MSTPESDALKMFGTQTPTKAVNSDKGPTSNISAGDLLDKLTTIKNNLKPFIGKMGYNAHLWASTHIKPLEDAIKKHVDNGEDISAELAAQVNSLPINPKPLAPGCEKNAINPPSQPQSAGGSVVTVPSQSVNPSSL